MEIDREKLVWLDRKYDTIAIEHRMISMLITMERRYLQNQTPGLQVCSYVVNVYRTWHHYRKN